jgi:hypothetical protein
MPTRMIPPRFCAAASVAARATKVPAARATAVRDVNACSHRLRGVIASLLSLKVGGP